MMYHGAYKSGRMEAYRDFYAADPQCWAAQCFIGQQFDSVTYESTTPYGNNEKVGHYVQAGDGRFFAG